MTQDEALAELRRLCPPAADPALSDPDDLLALLNSTARAQVRESNATVEVGQRIVPSPANGRTYRCVQIGVTAAVAPTEFSYPTSRGGVVQDGTALWEDDGPAHPNRYNLKAAANAGWMMKAGLASARFNVNAPGQSWEEDQVYQHCIKQAARYRPAFVR